MLHCSVILRRVKSSLYLFIGNIKLKVCTIWLVQKSFYIKFRVSIWKLKLIDRIFPKKFLCFCVISLPDIITAKLKSVRSSFILNNLKSVLINWVQVWYTSLILCHAALIDISKCLELWSLWFVFVLIAKMSLWCKHFFKNKFYVKILNYFYLN